MSQLLQRHKVWDLNVRIFHWVNAFTVLALMVIGSLILSADAFGIEGEGKVLMKTIHVYVGYLFVLNLLWRFIWAFFGSRYARWRQILPLGAKYLHSLRSYVGALLQGEHQRYLGHNPLARLIITLFFLLLGIQAMTGLVIAGTDLYMPPFGGYFAEQVTGGDEARLAGLKPGDKTFVIEENYAAMREFRKPVVGIHEFTFFTLLVLVVVHLAGVVFTEISGKNALISAMISGEKIMDGKPVDRHNDDRPGNQ